MMMKILRLTGLVGLLAGFLAALLYLVDYGPGNSLHRVAQWFDVDSQGTGRFVGFLLMILLGGVFGLLFGALVSRWQLLLGRWLLTGVVVGALWWLIVVLGIGSGLHHQHIGFADILFTAMPLLVYGLLLGSLAFQWRGRMSA